MTAFNRPNNNTDFKCNNDFLLKIFFPKITKVYRGISFETGGFRLCPIWTVLWFNVINLHPPQRVQTLCLKTFAVSSGSIVINWRIDCSSKALSCCLIYLMLIYGIIRELSDAINKDALDWQRLEKKVLNNTSRPQLNSFNLV